MFGCSQTPSIFYQIYRNWKSIYHGNPGCDLRWLASLPLDFFGRNELTKNSVCTEFCGVSLWNVPSLNRQFQLVVLLKFQLIEWESTRRIGIQLVCLNYDVPTIHLWYWLIYPTG